MGAVDRLIDEVKPLFDRWIENKLGKPVGIPRVEILWKQDRVIEHRTLSRTVHENGCVDVTVEYKRLKVLDLRFYCVVRPTPATIRLFTYTLGTYVVVETTRETFHECPGHVELASAAMFEGDADVRLTDEDHADLVAALRVELSYDTVVEDASKI